MTSLTALPNTNQSLISIRNGFNTLFSQEPETSKLHSILRGSQASVLASGVVSITPPETFDLTESKIGDCLLFVQIHELLASKAVPKNKIKDCLQHLFNVEKKKSIPNTNVQGKALPTFFVIIELKKRFASLLFDLYASDGILSNETSMQILNICGNVEKEDEKENHVRQIEQDLIDTMLSDPQVQQDIESQQGIVLKYLPTNIAVKPIDMWFLIQFVNNLEGLVSANRLLQSDKNNPNQAVPLSQETIKKIILNMLDQDDLMACELKMPYRVLFKDVVDERIGNGLVTEPIFLLALDKIVKKVKRHKDRKEKARKSETQRSLKAKNKGQSILQTIRPKNGGAIVVEMADRISQNIQSKKKLGLFSLGTIVVDIGGMSLPEDVLEPEILESIEPIGIASIPNVDNVVDLVEQNVSIPTLEQDATDSTPSATSQDTTIPSSTPSDSSIAGNQTPITIESRPPATIAQTPANTQASTSTPASNTSDDKSKEKSKNEKSSILLWSLLGVGVVGVGAYMYMQSKKKQ